MKTYIWIPPQFLPSYDVPVQDKCFNCSVTTPKDHLRYCILCLPSTSLNVPVCLWVVSRPWTQPDLICSSVLIDHIWKWLLWLGYLWALWVSSYASFWFDVQTHLCCSSASSPLCRPSWYFCTSHNDCYGRTCVLPLEMNDLSKSFNLQFLNFLPFL